MAGLTPNTVSYRRTSVTPEPPSNEPYASEIWPSNHAFFAARKRLKHITCPTPSRSKSSGSAGRTTHKFTTRNAMPHNDTPHIKRFDEVFLPNEAGLRIMDADRMKSWMD